MLNLLYGEVRHDGGHGKRKGIGYVMNRGYILAVIEKYTRNARFCLICNYASRIIPALQSRCTRFRFAPLKRQLIEKRVRFIADKEG